MTPQMMEAVPKTCVEGHYENGQSIGASSEAAILTHDEAIWLIRGAHALNVREHPCLNTELDSAGDDGGDDLRPEHGAWRNLHVMAELEVGGELQRLGHRDVPPCLEHHHGDGASGERVADDQLRDDTMKKQSM